MHDRAMPGDTRQLRPQYLWSSMTEMIIPSVTLANNRTETLEQMQVPYVVVLLGGTEKMQLWMACCWTTEVNQNNYIS